MNTYQGTNTVINHKPKDEKSCIKSEPISRNGKGQATNDKADNYTRKRGKRMTTFQSKSISKKTYVQVVANKKPDNFR